MTDHSRRKTSTSYPGVAQLVARVVWDHQVGGSSPSTRTKSSLKSAISESFSYSLSIAAHNLMVFVCVLILEIIFGKISIPEDCLCFGMVPTYEGIFLLINLCSFLEV